VPLLPGGGVLVCGGVEAGECARATPRSVIAEACERRRYAWAPPAPHSARRPPHGGRGWHACGRSPADDPGGWSGGRGPGARPGCGPDASGAGSGRGSPARRQDRPRPAEAYHRAAAPPCLVQRSCRVGPCPQGWPSGRGRDPARRAPPLEPSDQPARSQVKRPVDPDDDIRARGRDGVENRCWGGWHVPETQQLPRLGQEAEGHRAGVPVEATVTLVWLGVASPEVSSAACGSLPHASSPTVVC
jgi:hypothetical protein